MTERPGRLRLVARDGKLSAPLSGLPAVHASGQGGLLDVVLDPEFARNKTIYLSYSERGENGTSGTAAASARLGDKGLTNVKVIYRQHPKVMGSGHYGSRIVFRRGGDELNQPRAGKNYGWPVITYGIDYSTLSRRARRPHP